MKLNCKAGDLAYIHGLTVTPEANGMVVEVLRLCVPGEVVGGVRFLPTRRGAAWVVAGHSIPSRTTLGVLLYLHERPVGDVNLRPIRDQPGEDETLTWAGLPRYMAGPDELRRLRESLGVPA